MSISSVPPLTLEWHIDIIKKHVNALKFTATVNNMWPPRGVITIIVTSLEGKPIDERALIEELYLYGLAAINWTIVYKVNIISDGGLL